MFIQFDRINRLQPQTRRVKAVSDDGTFQNALEQIEPPVQPTIEQSENQNEPEAAPDYRSISSSNNFNCSGGSATMATCYCLSQSRICSQFPKTSLLC